jgi:hypothetical protein
LDRPPFFFSLLLDEPGSPVLQVGDAASPFPESDDTTTESRQLPRKWRPARAGGTITGNDG